MSRRAALASHIVAYGALTLAAAACVLAFVLMLVASPAVVAVSMTAAATLTAAAVWACSRAGREDRAAPRYARLSDRRPDGRIPPPLTDRFDWDAFERQFAAHAARNRR